MARKIGQAINMAREPDGITNVAPFVHQEFPGNFRLYVRLAGLTALTEQDPRRTATLALIAPWVHAGDDVAIAFFKDFRFYGAVYPIFKIPSTKIGWPIVSAEKTKVASNHLENGFMIYLSSLL